MKEKQIQQNMSFLAALQVPHSVLITNSSVRIEQPKGKAMYFSDAEVKKKHLWFIKAVKSEVQKSDAFRDRIEYLEGVSPDKVQYVSYRPGLPGLYYDAIELDINGAYWQAAYMLGYIGEELYCKAIEKEIPKLVRLIALGALARCRTEWRYDISAKKYRYIGMEKDKALSGVFFDCAKLISDTMRKLCNAIGSIKPGYNPFMFYWVDAIILNQSFAGFAANYLAEMGFSVKRKKIESIKIADDQSTAIIDDGSKDKRVFYFRKENGAKKGAVDFMEKINRIAAGRK